MSYDLVGWRPQAGRFTCELEYEPSQGSGEQLVVWRHIQEHANCLAVFRTSNPTKSQDLEGANKSELAKADRRDVQQLGQSCQHYLYTG